MTTMTTMTPTPLPIELWNIILTFAPHTVAKQFIYLAMVHKIFNPTELEVLKTNYIYDYLIYSNPLNKHIYHIYNKLETIDTKIKYITNYNQIFKLIMSLKHSHIMNSLILKDYLLTKIENEQHRIKFNNITIKINLDLCYRTNRGYTHMLKYL
jgi:hypothetical protein